MSQDRVKVRIAFAAREVEVEGTGQAVREWLDDLKPYIQQFAGIAADAPGPPRSDVPGLPDPGVPVPGMFGEFFHRFEGKLTDVDRMLIAGYFEQETGTDKVFTTRGAAELLREQKAEPANPSESVRRNVAMRRVYS